MVLGLTSIISKTRTRRLIMRNIRLNFLSNASFVDKWMVSHFNEYLDYLWCYNNLGK